jgi:membrane protease YdiL (CAAX protease family)
MPSAAEEESAGDDPQFVSAASTDQRVQNVTHALLLVAGAFLAAGVVQGFGLSVLDSLGLTEDSAPVVRQLVPMALHFGTFIAVAGGYLAWRDDAGLVPFGWPSGRDVRWTLLGFAALVALLVGLDVVLSWLGLQPADNVSVQIGRENPQLFLYFVPLVIFLNAPAEELLFRGVVQGLFRRSYGTVPGVLGAALVFGLVHYVALVGTGSRLAYVLIAFVSGLVLGALQEYTENLAVPIAVHALWNVIIYLNLYAGATGLL